MLHIVSHSLQISHFRRTWAFAVVRCRHFTGNWQMAGLPEQWSLWIPAIDGCNDRRLENGVICTIFRCTPSLSSLAISSMEFARPNEPMIVAGLNVLECNCDVDTCYMSCCKSCFGFKRLVKPTPQPRNDLDSPSPLIWILNPKETQVAC